MRSSAGSGACGCWCCCAGRACAGPRVSVGADGAMEVWHWEDPYDLPRMGPESAWTEVPYTSPRNVEKGDGYDYLPAGLTQDGFDDAADLVDL